MLDCAFFNGSDWLIAELAEVNILESRGYKICYWLRIESKTSQPLLMDVVRTVVFEFHRRIDENYAVATECNEEIDATNGTTFAVVKFRTSAIAHKICQILNEGLEYAAQGYIPPSSLTLGKYNILEYLNDDCLLHVLRMCDIESLANCYDVSERFRAAAIDERERRNVDGITCIIYFIWDYQRLFQVLRFYGPTQHTFTFRIFGNRTVPETPAILQYIGHYLKDNVENLSIGGVLFENWAYDLPFWPQLRKFKLHNTNFDFDYDFDLRSVASNLRKFKMVQNMVFELNAQAEWKTLDNLCIRKNQFMVGQTFVRFCENNRHLKTLNISSEDMQMVSEAIANHLQQLEKLSIYYSYPALTSNNLQFLADLCNLTQLTLADLEADHVLEIIDFVCDLRSLTHLKISCAEEEETVNLREDHPTKIVTHLKKLKVLHLNYVECTASQHLEIVRAMPTLEEYEAPLAGTDELFRADLNAKRSLAVDGDVNRKLKIVVNSFVGSPRYEETLFLLDFIDVTRNIRGTQANELHF